MQSTQQDEKKESDGTYPFADPPEICTMKWNKHSSNRQYPLNPG